MLRGMLDARDSQYPRVIIVTQTSLNACLGLSAFDGCVYAIVFFIIVQRFSIELRSGLFQSHSSTDILLCSGTQWPPLIGDNERHIS